MLILLQELRLNDACGIIKFVRFTREYSRSGLVAMMFRRSGMSSSDVDLFHFHFLHVTSTATCAPQSTFNCHGAVSGYLQAFRYANPLLATQEEGHALWQAMHNLSRLRIPVRCILRCFSPIAHPSSYTSYARCSQVLPTIRSRDCTDTSEALRSACSTGDCECRSPGVRARKIAQLLYYSPLARLVAEGCSLTQTWFPLDDL